MKWLCYLEPNPHTASFEINWNNVFWIKVNTGKNLIPKSFASWWPFRTAIYTLSYKTHMRHDFFHDLWFGNATQKDGAQAYIFFSWSWFSGFKNRLCRLWGVWRKLMLFLSRAILGVSNCPHASVGTPYLPFLGKAVSLAIHCSWRVCKSPVHRLLEMTTGQTLFASFGAEHVRVYGSQRSPRP